MKIRKASTITYLCLCVCPFILQEVTFKLCHSLAIKLRTVGLHIIILHFDAIQLNRRRQQRFNNPWLLLYATQQAPARAEECSTVVIQLIQLQTSKSAVASAQLSEYTPICLAVQSLQIKHKTGITHAQHVSDSQCCFEADNSQALERGITKSRPSVEEGIRIPTSRNNEYSDC